MLEPGNWSPKLEDRTMEGAPSGAGGGVSPQCRMGPWANILIDIYDMYTELELRARTRALARGVLFQAQIQLPALG